MAMLRTAKCDLCETIETEREYGAGWAGWAILQGIAARAPSENEPMTTENTSMIICPEHKNMVSDFISEIQKAKGD